MPQAGSDPLVGARAFEALRRRLIGEESVEPTRFAAPAFRRLAHALDELGRKGSARPSPLDMALLVRQVLRYQDVQLEGAEPVALTVPAGDNWPSEDDWAQVGVIAQPISGGYRVQARPWRPEWLSAVGESGVDAAAAGEFPRRPDMSVPGDPFLLSLGRRYYRSPGQRAAVRAALTTPPGATLLVSLPTGDGKSLIFQLVSEVGFPDAGPGVTLVVTPTVALALDHERAAHEMGLATGQLAYRGGGGISQGNREILDNIAAGTQKICFASPEAVCGPLRPALVQAARAGRFRALVVDEAHLVEAWGVSFRSEFQLISGVRRELLKVTRGPAPRTFLLSATLTSQTIDTLRALFGGDDENGTFAVYSASRLRTEIDYWVAPVTDEEERQGRVLEAIFHLPRPAILYVTERSHADWWLRHLREIGFHRIARVTGNTPSAEREEVLQGWRRGTVDLVVGTSAFGLGVDNPHVRSVIHATVPETLDRFYQEVGRGGRDGYASISLLLPAWSDIKTARGLNHPRIITSDRAYARWQAMFTHPDRKYDPGTDTYVLRVDVPPGVDADRIDMESEQNTEWHFRTLVLMANAGLIRLLSPESGVDLTQTMESQDSSTLQFRPYQRVQVLDPRHLDATVWKERVEPHRRRLASAYRKNLEQMLKYLKAEDCAANLIAPLYEVTEGGEGGSAGPEVRVAKACGGCPHCRANGRAPYHQPGQETPFPWLARPVTKGTGAELLDRENRVVVFYSASDEGLSRDQFSRLVDGIAVLLGDSGIHNVVLSSESGVDPLMLQERTAPWPLFVSQSIPFSGLPPGPAVVVLGRGERLTRSLLRPRPKTDARFFFIPGDVEDPNAPGTLLRDRHSGRQLKLEQFLRLVGV